MTGLKKDSHYVEAFERFITKFDCAAKRILADGIVLHDRLENRFLKLSGTRDYGGRGGPGENTIPKLYGPHYPIGHWYVMSPRVILATPNVEYHRLHPFVYMADGKFSISSSYYGAPDVRHDLEIVFGFENSTLTTAFSQGYYNNENYKDCWLGSAHHWSLGAAFNVGRFMFNKYLVPQLRSNRLLCDIHPLLKKILK